MFRVIITEEYTDGTPTKTTDLAIKTEKLYELLGRYTVKYGPAELLVQKDGITSLEHYHTISDTSHVMVSIAYAKYNKDDELKKPKKEKKVMSIERHRTYDTNYPPYNHSTGSYWNSSVDDSITDDRFDMLVKSGAFTKRNY